AAPAGVTFLHPLALLGLAAAAIPALLHLLERRTPPEAEFPPLRYLRDAERQSARRLRLRHLLLLILRTALVAVIVLAAARPILPTGVGGGSGGSGGNGSGSVAVHAPTARIASAEPLPAREVHVLSDLQRTTLGAGSVDVPGVAVLVLAPPARVPANRGIAAARAGEGGLTIAVSGTPGASATPLVARVQPPGNAPTSAREAGRTLAAPGQSVTLPLPPLAPGWWIGEV